MKTIPIQVYGLLTDVTGSPIIEIEYSDTTVGLMQNLITQFPMLGRYQFIMAVNHTIVTENQDVEEHDLIAVLPPFAGG